MKICLYRCTAEPNRVNKAAYLSTPFSLDGTLVSDCSVVDPVIELEKTNPVFYQYNYLYIPDFKRFYFVNDWINLANKIWQLRAHVDVLYTYASEIYSANAIAVKSTASAVSSDEIDDGSYASKVPTEIKTYSFSGKFDGLSAVLVVAGKYEE